MAVEVSKNNLTNGALSDKSTFRFSTNIDQAFEYALVTLEWSFVAIGKLMPG